MKGEEVTQKLSIDFQAWLYFIFFSEVLNDIESSDDLDVPFQRDEK